MAGTRRGALQGVLRVGCLSTLGPRWLPGMLARLRRSCPGLAVELLEADSETLLQGLERGTLELALMYDLGLARAVRLDPLGALRPHALLPWGHPLAARASVGLAELAAEPFVLIDLPHSREYFMSLLREAGGTPRIAWRCTSLEMVRAMVANGLGVSLLTTRPLRDWAVDGKRLAVRRLRGRIREQSVVLASPASGQPQPELARAFAEAAREAFARAADD